MFTERRRALQKDNSGRLFSYIRVSVTDRCNLRCLYCMPEEGIPKLTHQETLSYEEIESIIRAAASEGVFRARITGGEPLVRKGLPGLVRLVRNISGIRDLAMTTNGVLLESFAVQLKEAGLDRINISLDSLQPERYRQITRFGDLSHVLKGIDKAVECGFSPVKVNVVLIPGMNDDEVEDFAKFAFENPVHVRFIEFMPFLTHDPEGKFISQDSVYERIASVAELVPIENKTGGGPSVEYSLKGGKGAVGFISPRSHPFCSECKRLRLTASGVLVPCLDSPDGIPVRGLSGERVAAIIRELGEKKLASGKNCAGFTGSRCSSLSEIGG